METQSEGSRENRTKAEVRMGCVVHRQGFSKVVLGFMDRLLCPSKNLRCQHVDDGQSWELCVRKGPQLAFDPV